MVLLAASVGLAEQITLKYWNWTALEIPGEEELIRSFETAHPNIKIELVTGPHFPLRERIISATRAGVGPDVFEFIPEWLVTFVNAGVIAPIDDLLASDKAVQDRFTAAAWEMGVWRGHAYGLPWRIGPSAMYVNKDMLDAAGLALPKVPWTWDDLERYASKLVNRTKGEYGYAFTGAKDSRGTSWEWFAFLFQNGGRMITGHEASFNTPAGVEALQFWVDLYRSKQLVPPGTPSLYEKDIVDLMGRGKVAMWHNGPWFIAQFANYPNAHIATVPLPQKVTTGSPAGGTLLGISPKSRYKEAAWEFVKYMTSDEVLGKWAQLGSFMPTTKALLARPEYTSGLLAAFTTQLNLPNTVMLGTNPEIDYLLDVLQAELQRALLGQSSAKDALDRAAKEWNATLAKYK
ncbi:sugar ABC transporter substrate-binding protein [Carboxydochorda subterranea]|uniref:Sugar ABC transporter substrate-binding protein n=1 Tax=Carboxydichorda subterranea TaxID=3109565 RepID=A0ABZ1C211_9FIRM|nr:sugar ABC transporter substrate-binding protein [Limnochorda sp. L945t]WRP18944.1 sugar ABC transporter substrate-binding protein [Limnochorda sp. L945t]